MLLATKESFILFFFSSVSLGDFCSKQVNLMFLRVVGIEHMYMKLMWRETDLCFWCVSSGFQHNRY